MASNSKSWGFDPTDDKDIYVCLFISRNKDNKDVPNFVERRKSFIIILGRVFPKSGKIHQNQEVYHTGGVIPTLKATGYKNPFKIMEECRHDKSKTNG